MEVKGIKGTGIGSYDILNVSPSEMDKMIEVRNNVFEILKSHDKNSKKKQYISDEQLEYIWVMLCVLTEGVQHRSENSFDKKLKEIKKIFNHEDDHDSIASAFLQACEEQLLDCEE